jgi:hypothetical protein
MRSSIHGSSQRRVRESNLVILSILSLGATSPDGRPAAQSEPPELYELVTSTTIPILPEPLRGFLDAHSDTICRQIVRGPTADEPSDARAQRSARGFIKLDAAATSNTPRAMHDAARGFPHDREAAKKLFDQSRQHEGGALPWELERAHRELERAFSAGNLNDVVSHAAVVIQLSSFASLPFNMTRSLDGDEWHRPDWCRGEASAVDNHCALRVRFQVALLTRFRDRIAYEARVSPERFRPSRNSLDTIFEVLVDSHRQLEEIARIDADVLAELRIADASHFLAARDAYELGIAARGAQIVEGRIEAAALLSADLIGSAWIRSGRALPEQPRPDAKTEKTAIRPQEKPAVEPESTATSGSPFAGSTNSTVFHFSTCAHLRRVRPENIVGFASLSEAKAAGRTPCKTCAPDE